MWRVTILRCWWVIGVPVLLLGESTLASPQPSLPWNDPTLQGLNYRDTRVLLAKVVKEITKDIHRKDFPESNNSGKRTRRYKASSENYSSSNISHYKDLGSSKMAFFHAKNNSALNIAQNVRRRKHIIKTMRINKRIYPKKTLISYINHGNGSQTRKNTTQLDAAGAEALSDLQREAKKAVYRRLLTRALKQHLQVHRQLEELRKKGDTNDALVRQWVRFSTSPEAALSLLVSLKKDITRSPYHHILTKKRTNEHTNLGTDWEAREEMARNSNLELKTENIINTPVSIFTSNKLLHPTPEASNSSKSLNRTQLLRFLSKLLISSLNITKKTTAKRQRRSEGSGVMYLPVGGTTKVSCPTAADAAGVSLAQMAFLSVCLSVFNIILNVSNNINNNNNNNNLNTDNNLSNNNAQLSLNSNSGNQVNVMLPPPIPGKRRRRGPLWHSM